MLILKQISLNPKVWWLEMVNLSPSILDVIVNISIIRWKCCDKYDDSYGDSKIIDNYFVIKHRGIGGIFFDLSGLIDDDK